MQKTNRLPMSKTVKLHYFKLIYRSLIFISTILLYILNRINVIDKERFPVTSFGIQPIMMVIIFVCFTVEMVARSFPVKNESMGCQKVFKKNYVAFDNPAAPKEKDLAKRTAFVGVIWVIFNILISIPYFLRLIDRGIMLLIALCFSICDLICILFYCPFQSLMLKNKCCVSCRIYNWDFFMMFSPFAFILFDPAMNWFDRSFTVILFSLSVFLLVRWEITHARHPEYFSERTNRNVMCASCHERLCASKIQLRSFLAKNRELYFLKGNLVVHSKIDSIKERAAKQQQEKPPDNISDKK